MTSENPFDRRHSNERRNSLQATQFPIITRHGVCVRSDRRRLPDRRISQIEVFEKNVREDTFDFLFSKFKKKN